jgi:hypothetical protein
MVCTQSKVDDGEMVPFSFLPSAFSLLDFFACVRVVFGHFSELPVINVVSSSNVVVTINVVINIPKLNPTM